MIPVTTAPAAVSTQASDAPNLHRDIDAAYGSLVAARQQWSNARSAPEFALAKSLALTGVQLLDSSLTSAGTAHAELIAGARDAINGVLPVFDLAIADPSNAVVRIVVRAQPFHSVTTSFDAAGTLLEHVLLDLASVVKTTAAR